MELKTSDTSVKGVASDSGDITSKVDCLSLDDSSIVRRYRESLQKTEECVVLYHEDVILRSEKFPVHQSTTNVDITPALLPTDESTVLYGYLVEAKSSKSANERHSTVEEYESVLSIMNDFDFVNINDTIVMPIERDDSEPYRDTTKNTTVPTKVSKNDVGKKSMRKEFCAPTTTSNANSNSDQVVVYARIGGTIVKQNTIKVIKATKSPKSVFMGALGVKTAKMNSTLKIYFDHDLCVTTSNILNDDRVRRVHLEICT